MRSGKAGWIGLSNQIAAMEKGHEARHSPFVSNKFNDAGLGLHRKAPQSMRGWARQHGNLVCPCSLFPASEIFAYHVCDLYLKEIESITPHAAERGLGQPSNQHELSIYQLPAAAAAVASLSFFCAFEIAASIAFSSFASRGASACSSSVVYLV